MSLYGSAALTLGALFAQAPIDPALPNEIRRDIEQVAAAELDPKRGPDTALSRLAELQETHKQNERLHNALRLRGAGVFLRKRFLAAAQFPVAVRYQQALSTFTRLDLTEPGLATWIDRTLEAHKTAPKKGHANHDHHPQLKIPVALLIRGSALKRSRVQAAFKAPFSSLGYTLVFGPVRQAAFILKLGVKDAPSDSPALRAIQVSLDIEGKADPEEMAWERSFFRTEAAAELEPAVEAALQWLARIGGRDLFFQWLSVTALPFVAKNPFVRKSEAHRH